jgi:hypothetical protein
MVVKVTDSAKMVRRGGAGKSYSLTSTKHIRYKWYEHCSEMSPRLAIVSSGEENTWVPKFKQDFDQQFEIMIDLVQGWVPRDGAQKAHIFVQIAEMRR